MNQDSSKDRQGGCPACERNVNAWETKVGDTNRLCQQHHADLNNNLQGVLASHPEVQAVGNDLASTNSEPPKTHTKSANSSPQDTNQSNLEKDKIRGRL